LLSPNQVLSVVADEFHQQSGPRLGIEDVDHGAQLPGVALTVSRHLIFIPAAKLAADLEYVASRFG
jgi:hypothetical protein